MSSSDIAVSVRGLSKSYTIAHNAARHTTAGEALMHRLRYPFQRAETETFWALKDVDFDIQKGDVVGIIGRNGAGKSTLLKILSRITEPTAGEINLYGRVGSLLEVGTGFHPELTGRENIFLNGAILGMSKREIAREFDAIVDFAGVEQFLDTPVKRYSSGMYVRLAFAVAAHLNPEILIVDEVLAVGDAEFQKKCLGKMGEVARQGRTVLFVSHNVNAILSLCQKAILLRKGCVATIGSVQETLQIYSDEVKPSAYSDLVCHPNSIGSQQGLLQRIALYDENCLPSSTFELPSDMMAKITVKVKNPVRLPRLSLGINNWRGERVCAVATYLAPGSVSELHDTNTITVRFSMPALVPGRYLIDIGLAEAEGGFLHAVYSSIAFDALECGFLGTSIPYFPDMGQVMVRSIWSLD